MIRGGFLNLIPVGFDNCAGKGSRYGFTGFSLKRGGKGFCHQLARAQRHLGVSGLRRVRTAERRVLHSSQAEIGSHV